MGILNLHKLKVQFEAWLMHFQCQTELHTKIFEFPNELFAQRNLNFSKWGRVFVQYQVGQKLYISLLKIVQKMNLNFCSAWAAKVLYDGKSNAALLFCSNVFVSFWFHKALDSRIFAFFNGSKGELLCQPIEMHVCLIPISFSKQKHPQFNLFACSSKTHWFSPVNGMTLACGMLMRHQSNANELSMSCWWDTQKMHWDTDEMPEMPELQMSPHTYWLKQMWHFTSKNW